MLRRSRKREFEMFGHHCAVWVDDLKVPCHIVRCEDVTDEKSTFVMAFENGEAAAKVFHARGQVPIALWLPSGDQFQIIALPTAFEYSLSAWCVGFDMLSIEEHNPTHAPPPSQPTA